MFIARDGEFVATELARGPWDPGAQHGGAPAALLMRALEQLPSPNGLLMARVTYEFLRPVPIGPLALVAEVVRPGRNVQLLEGSLSTAEGVEVVRARALQVHAAVTGGDAAPGPAIPAGGGDYSFDPPYRPMFHPDAIEIRFSAGTFGGGPSTAWFRLRVPLLEGEEASPLQRLAAAADFGNGISATLSWDEFVFINPDLTIYLEREPRGEWVCLDSTTVIRSGGIGTAESVLFDQRGRVGRATQALLVAPRPSRR